MLAAPRSFSGGWLNALSMYEKDSEKDTNSKQLSFKNQRRRVGGR